MLPDEALETLWLSAVAAYDSSANPSPEFASVAAVRTALRASPLVDASAFDVVVVAVAGRAMHERGDKTLLDYAQARPGMQRERQGLALGSELGRAAKALTLRPRAQFVELMGVMMPDSAW